MKKLYGIAENHDYTLRGVYFTQKLLNESSLPSGAKERFERELIATKKLYKKKENTLENLIEETEPLVFFHEGLENVNSSLLGRLGFEGKVVALDRGCEEYKKMVKEMTEAGKDLFQNFKGEDKGELKQGIKKYYDTTRRVVHSYSKPRERHWAGKVLKEYQEPSIILAGAAHLNSVSIFKWVMDKVPRKSGFPSLLEKLGFDLEVCYSDSSITNLILAKLLKTGLLDS